jgi:hypothetical protein
MDAAGVMRDAAKISTATIVLIEAIMQTKPHPGGAPPRSSRHPAARAQLWAMRPAAAGDDIGARSYGWVKSILHRLDRACSIVGGDTRPN